MANYQILTSKQGKFKYCEIYTKSMKFDNIENFQNFTFGSEKAKTNK